MTRTLTRKLTTSGNIEEIKAALVADKNASIFVCRIAGIATGTKTNVHPQFGESTALVGQFRRVNPDGTTQDAAVLWGTDTLIQPVANALANGATSVQVLADVHAAHSTKGTLGFQYVLVVHGEEAADPLTALLSGLPTMPALPAPTAPKEAAPVKAGKKG